MGQQFNGTVTGSTVHDRETGRFANRRDNSGDLPLFDEPSVTRRAATPSKLAPRRSKDGETLNVQGTLFVSGKVRGGVGVTRGGRPIPTSVEVNYLSGRKLDNRAAQDAREVMAKSPDLFGGHTLV